MLSSFPPPMHQRPFLLCVSFVLLFSISNPPEIHSQIKQPIRVGITDNEPMCYIDDTGKPAGIFVEVIGTKKRPRLQVPPIH